MSHVVAFATSTNEIVRPLTVSFAFTSFQLSGGGHFMTLSVKHIKIEASDQTSFSTKELYPHDLHSELFLCLHEYRLKAAYTFGAFQSILTTLLLLCTIFY